MGHKISKEQLDPSVIEFMTAPIGNLDELETEDKSSLVNAINSLLAGAEIKAEDIGKIAEAIGEPVTVNDSIDDVVSKVNDLVATFKANMMNNGVVVEAEDKFKTLIDKIASLADSEGKGIKYATGSFSSETYTTQYVSETTVDLHYDLDFTPTILFIKLSYNGGASNAGGSVSNTRINNYIIASDTENMIDRSSDTIFGGWIKYELNNISSTHVSVKITDSTAQVVTGNFLEYYAIGVGEEDTTLRDSLADILGDKGIDVTEEDDMASLISKVDGMSSGLDIISAASLPATGRENQICVITGNNINEYNIIPRYENNVNGKITLITCNDTSLPLIKCNGRVSYEFHVSDVIYNNEYLSSYYYSNGWKELTQPKQYIYKYGTWVDTTIMGSLTPDGSKLVGLDEGLQVIKGSNRFTYCYFSGSVSLASYNTIEIWATNNSSYSTTLSIEGRSTGSGNGSADGWTQSLYTSSSATLLNQGFNKYTIDISSFTGSCYHALILRNLDNSYGSSDIIIHAILVY